MQNILNSFLTNTWTVTIGGIIITALISWVTKSLINKKKFKVNIHWFTIVWYILDDKGNFTPKGKPYGKLVFYCTFYSLSSNKIISNILDVYFKKKNKWQKVILERDIINLQGMQSIPELQNKGLPDPFHFNLATQRISIDKDNAITGYLVLKYEKDLYDIREKINLKLKGKLKIEVTLISGKKLHKILKVDNVKQILNIDFVPPPI